MQRLGTVRLSLRLSVWLGSADNLATLWIELPPSQRRAMSLSSLANEVIIECLQHLDFKSLLAFAQVSLFGQLTRPRIATLFTRH